MIKKIYNNYIYKARLNNAFVVAGIYLEFKKGDTPIKRYPSIGAFHNKKEYLEYTFYLPQGMNPEIIEKKSYIFKQTFGELYDMSVKGTRYILKVYKKEPKTCFDYDVNEMQQFAGYGIPIIAGYNMLGELLAYDMTPNPHLLIAGESGSGKSCCVRSILTTLLLYKRHEIDFYLADMKRSEFHLFRHCEGVKEVITDKGRLLKVLSTIHKQIKIRGDILDHYGFDHIDEYNKLEGVEKIKTILVAIDEVALLKKEKHIREMIEDISTQGRALKLMLILSMQRPDSKILDGQLKANLTVRYAFRHADGINSRITLGDGSGVDASTIGKNEKGKFYMRNDEVLLLQAPYLTLEKAKELLVPIKTIPIPTEIPEEVIVEDVIEEYAEGVTILGGKKDE